jgi:hypothetical protein
MVCSIMFICAPRCGTVLQHFWIDNYGTSMLESVRRNHTQDMQDGSLLLSPAPVSVGTQALDVPSEPRLGVTGQFTRAIKELGEWWIVATSKEKAEVATHYSHQ